MIPERLAANARDVHGARGEEWLAALPMLLAECARRWTLAIDAPFADLTYNYVAPATRGAAGVVLNVGVPHPELWCGIAALGAFRGESAVRLLAFDPERGALLLERLEPGAPLSTLADDAESTAIAARLMRSLWRDPPAGHGFPRFADWAARAFARVRAKPRGAPSPLPESLVVEAEAIFAAAGSRDATLLHGDLHHTNVL